MRLIQFRVGILIPALLFWGVVIIGCSLKSEPLKRAQKFAENHQFQQYVFETQSSQILAFIKKQKKSRVARIYMEGDGLAWVRRNKISSDPTPTDPVGLYLAAVDQSQDDIIYLARPCQYLMSPQCQPADWTSARYGRKIINTYQEILKQLREDYDAFHLYGFSGGATVALLLAAEQDIKTVTTFAGLLDTDAWTHHHHYSPLADSLNPADLNSKLQNIPQQHFIGEADKQLPLTIAKSYLSNFKNPNLISLIIVPKYTHNSDWSQFWQSYQNSKL